VASTWNGATRRSRTDATGQQYRCHAAVYCLTDCSRDSNRSISSPTFTPLRWAGRRASNAAGSAPPAAELTLAYCAPISDSALADHGMSSQSRTTQSVESRSQKPACSSALATMSISSRSSGSPLEKNRRPVLV
jgi:hypothetical protein